MAAFSSPYFTGMFKLNHLMSGKTNQTLSSRVMSMQLLCNTANQACLWPSLNK